MQAGAVGALLGRPGWETGWFRVACCRYGIEMHIDDLQALVRNVADERDWAQFPPPRNLALAMMGEVGEVAELMQWTADSDMAAWLKDETNKTKLKHELADVFSYLLRLSDVCGVQLDQALVEKTAINEERYPVALAKGSSKKYDVLDPNQ